MACSFSPFAHPPPSAWRWFLALVLSAGLIACSSPASENASPPTTALPQAPLKIPMPLDKAGHKIDVTFEVPPKPPGSRSYFVGLRMLFTPGIMDSRIDVIDQNPVSVRLFIDRIENGKEIPVPLLTRKDVAKPYEFSDFQTFQIENNIASTTGYYSDYSGAPPGTPDASTYVMRFAGPQDDSPGVYRLRLETLKDISQLSGIKAFLVYETHPRR